MKNLLLILLFSFTTQCYAQNNGTQFQEITLSQALSQIKNNPKGPQQLFIDCYTTWCSPCKLMEQKVFPLKEMGLFMNTNFINIKVDMEKEAGKEITQKYGTINSFPTFLIINSEGEEINRIVGGELDPTAFINTIKQAMAPQQTIADAKRNTESTIRIIGKLKSNSNTITLLRTTHGRTDTLLTTTTTDNDSFQFTFKSKEKGLYTLYDEMYAYRLYLAPGDRANISIENNQLILTGENTTENKILNEWERISLPLRQHSLHFFEHQVDPQQFFNELNALTLYRKYLTPKSDSSDPDFKRLMKHIAEFDLDYYALYYLYSPLGYNILPENYPDFYREIFNEGKLASEYLMSLPYGTELLTLYSRFGTNGEQNPQPEQVFPFIPNTLYRGEIILQYANQLHSLEEYETLLEHHKQYITTPDQQTRADKIKQRLLPYKRGNKAFEFTFSDAQGKSVSLSDFTGKLVFLDIWATTCMPCIAEIPHLKALEKQFQGKEIVFIGLSTDRVIAQKTWLEFISKEALTGIQLFGGGWNNSVIQDYRISSIPRFMLFDRQGNIITVDAPPPSDSRLKSLIEQYL